MLTLHTPQQAADWLRERMTGRLCSDSRALLAGDVFMAWPGAAHDARIHVTGALAKGAAACLVEAEGAEKFDWPQDRVACYRQLKAASGEIAAACFGHPSEDLSVLAVTGTNGKTSSAWWLAQALSNLKLSTPIPCGLVGTLGIGRVPAPGEPVALESTGLTTPDPVRLQQAFRRFADQGLRACAIEASSIGLAEHRLAGTRIHTALFTNFTQDHLDYHGNLAAYWKAKQALFDWPGLKAAVVNLDDPQGEILAQQLQGRDLALWTVSCQDAVAEPARLRALDVHYGDAGLVFIVAEGEERQLLQTGLLGGFNVSNLLGVIAAMRSLGVSLQVAVEACAALAPVPGRMECHSAPGHPLVVVDYAHTPDALAKALAALQPLARERGGELCCVFGCGGDRDRAKRPLMAAQAERLADRLVLTSDNPRSESPQAILDQMLLGLKARIPAIQEPDRARAIAAAIAQARPQDVVLVAGKGHEDYQELASGRVPFSDLDQVAQALARSPQLEAAA
jgi:MurE/MurF fusion protein